MDCSKGAVGTASIAVWGLQCCMWGLHCPACGGCTAACGGCTALHGGCSAACGGCSAACGGCTALHGGLHCPAWGLHCYMWGLHCPAWGLHCPAWGLHCPAWGLHCPAWGLHPPSALTSHPGVSLLQAPHAGPHPSFRSPNPRALCTMAVTKHRGRNASSAPTTQPGLFLLQPSPCIGAATFLQPPDPDPGSPCCTHRMH